MSRFYIESPFTQDNFNKIIELMILYKQSSLVKQIKDRPLVAEFLAQEPLNFNNGEYLKVLRTWFIGYYIPGCMQEEVADSDISTIEHVAGGSEEYLYSVKMDISSARSALNSVTVRDFAVSPGYKLKNSRHLELLLFLEKHPSIFTQLSGSLMLYFSVSLLVSALVLCVGENDAGSKLALAAGVMTGACAFFSVKKPGLSGEFLCEGASEERVTEQTQMLSENGDERRYGSVHNV